MRLRFHRHAFPRKRMRRMRRDDFSRRLMRETRLSRGRPHLSGVRARRHEREEPVPSLPGVARKSIDRLLRDAERCVALGIPAMALFPVIGASRSPTTQRAPGTATDSCRAPCARSSRAFPALGVITDVALDPYTSHGQDGLIDATGLRDERRDRRGARAAGALPRGSGRRHRRALRHDGRARRRAARCARRRRPHPHAHPRVLREICVVVLRAVPRRGRLGGQSRQAATSTPTRWTRRTATRRCGKSYLDIQRRRRHGDGQAGPAVSRHRAAREGRVRRADRRVPGVAASTRC